MKEYIDKKIKDIKQIRLKNAMIVGELRLDNSKNSKWEVWYIIIKIVYINICLIYKICYYIIIPKMEVILITPNPKY